MVDDGGEAVARDLVDPLGRFRDEFRYPPGRIYLDGNSLGLVSKRSEAATLRAVAAWRDLAIGGWLEADQPWFGLAESVGGLTAPLVGAEADQVVATGSTTANLHQLLCTLFHPAGRRRRILADSLAFPSDLYAIRSHLRVRGSDKENDLVLVPSDDARTLSEDAIIAMMTDDIAMAVLPSVVYRSGQLLDMERIAREGRSRGVIVGFDCSHSVGAVPHRLDDWGADFAFWCGYKYLNGGPGAVGGLYLNRRHFGVDPGLAGWFGSKKDRQFAMSSTFEPAEGAAMLQVGTPHILSMAPLVGALEVIAEAGIDAIRRKSLALNGYLRGLVERHLPEFGFATPVEDHRRGGHLALTHPEAARICKAMIADGVVPDHRPPDIVRLAPVALYTSFAEVDEVVKRLRSIMDRRAFESFPTGRGLVS